jgi:hypothetical protein
MNPDHMPRPHNPPHSSPVNTGANWPAYPVTEDSYHEPSRGLTKRELFAAMAMQGALGGAPGSHLVPNNLARESVMYADDLLAELAKDGAP